MKINSIRSKSRELAQEVLEQAKSMGCTIGSAESCTGGMIAAELTEVPGSSDAFVGGVVSYWVDVKEGLLGVDPTIIERHGIVSAECAAAMAQGAQNALACDYAVSTTGIAGPSGAEPGKPVGTVWYGVATPHSVETFTTCEGQTREEVRALAVQNALSALLAALR